MAKFGIPEKNRKLFKIASFSIVIIFTFIIPIGLVHAQGFSACTTPKCQQNGNRSVSLQNFSSDRGRLIADVIKPVLSDTKNKAKGIKPPPQLNASSSLTDVGYSIQVLIELILVVAIPIILIPLILKNLPLLMSATVFDYPKNQTRAFDHHADEMASENSSEEMPSASGMKDPNIDTQKTQVKSAGHEE
jgi:hypothetical protein